ncbi:MAG: hypothetical protein VX978_06305 [Pseudomonadota bacterium]|nr:hypothetical protein [Pseudomonadota bacterium]MED5369089.1 hypothetical protein [Pseudomonadota bacterium]
MSNYEQKENTGALFEANNMKVLRQGKSLVNGHDCELIVTSSQTKDGRTLFDTYMKVGGFFPNQYKQEGDNKPDVTAPVLIHGEKMKLAGWKNVSKRGVHYVSLAFSPSDDNSPQHSEPAELSAVGQAAQDDVPDDNIPF